MKNNLFSYQKIRENPKATLQECLREQLKLINYDLQLFNYIHYVLKQPSEEEINFLEKEREWILEEIYQAGWNEKRLELLNNCKELWQTQNETNFLTTNKNPEK